MTLQAHSTNLVITETDLTSLNQNFNAHMDKPAHHPKTRGGMHKKTSCFKRVGCKFMKGSDWRLRLKRDGIRFILKF